MSENLKLILNYETPLQLVVENIISLDSLI